MTHPSRELLLARDRFSKTDGWRDALAVLSGKEEEALKILRALFAHLEDRPDDLVLAFAGLEAVEVRAHTLIGAYGLVDQDLERLARAAIARHPELASRARAWLVTNS